MDIGICIDIFDKGYSRWGDYKYKKLNEIGYRAIDFNMADTSSDIYSLPQEKCYELLDKEKQMIEDAGMKISQAHGPWRWPAQDFSTDDRNERLEKMEKSIIATERLGCKYWVIHPIMPYGVHDIGTDNAHRTWELNLSFMCELLKIAKNHNITICLENMPMKEFSLAKPKDILRFVKTINDDNFKICLDTGHVSVFDDLSVGNEVRELGNEIKVFHIHDNKYGADLHLFPYFGRIDWKDFAKSLNDINYNGIFSLETGPSPELPNELFEELSGTLYKISATIIKQHSL